MKKLVRGSIIGLLIGVFSGVSMAYGCSNGFGCPGEFGGSIDMDSFATGGNTSFGGLVGSNGMTIGGGTSFGVSMADLKGGVTNGNVEGNVSSTGGGFSDTTTFKTPDSIGSQSQSFGITEGTLFGRVDPVGFGVGSVDGYFSGSVNQNTHNASVLGSGSFNSTGITGGEASQQGNGFFTGSGWAISGPDVFGKDSYGEFGVSAGITMEGISGSESYRFTNTNGNQYTEGMGTNVFAQTQATSYGNGYTDTNKLGAAGFNVNGGFCVDGIAKSGTTQFNDNGFASSNTTGKYAGGGTLGTNYTGSANGYSFTSLTTGPGGGTISYAESGMKVSSILD